MDKFFQGSLLINLIFIYIKFIYVEIIDILYKKTDLYLLIIILIFNNF